MKKDRNSNDLGAWERIKMFSSQHPVLMNLVYVLLAAFVAVWLLMCFLDSWTRHGDEATVPSLKGQSIDLATMTLENEGFKCEVMDSVYESNQRPGTVVEQNPEAGSRVKPGRTVYMTIVAFSPKMVTVPDFMNVSMRQGRSMFEGLGVNVHVVTVSSQYENLVLGAKVNGVPIKPGQRIPITSNVTLEVGGGDFIDEDDVEPNLVMPDGGEGNADENDSRVFESEPEEDPINILLND